ncbi:ACT domain, Ankyrin repeat-containing domain protein [Artemisia annua]|uniref:ACT domain, Ankyrin repeat-containing domain protein n=1 Tax=Artemisia annua TaxID=35608 RepID=A0A2U1NH58_ARTAN|nr:ACT domain, Ankyrin repeat-containing domain protein [Artemisia annua]
MVSIAKSSDTLIKVYMPNWQQVSTSLQLLTLQRETEKGEGYSFTESCCRWMKRSCSSGICLRAIFINVKNHNRWRNNLHIFLCLIVNKEQPLLLQQNWRRLHKIGTKLACEDRDCPVCKEYLLRKQMSHANEAVKMLNGFEAMVKSDQSGNVVKRLDLSATPTNQNFPFKHLKNKYFRSIMLVYSWVALLAKAIWVISTCRFQCMARRSYMGCNTILRCGILGVLYSRLTEQTIPIISGTCYAIILLTDFHIVLDASRVEVKVDAEKQHATICLRAGIEERASTGVRLELFKLNKPGLSAEVKRTFRENTMNVTEAERSTATGMAQILMSKSSNLDHLMRFFRNGNPIWNSNFCSPTNRLMWIIEYGLALVADTQLETAGNIVSYVAWGNISISMLITVATNWSSVVITPNLNAKLAVQYVAVDAIALLMSTLQGFKNVGSWAAQLPEEKRQCSDPEQKIQILFLLTLGKHRNQIVHCDDHV